MATYTKVDEPALLMRGVAGLMSTSESKSQSQLLGWPTNYRADSLYSVN